MIPQNVVAFFAAHQELLWLTTLVLDLGGTVILYRLFGKAGLQVAIATAIILANLQGPKLTVIVDLRTAIALGAAKYVFKIAIALIDTVFIYWARIAFGQRHPAEAQSA